MLIKNHLLLMTGTSFFWNGCVKTILKFLDLDIVALSKAKFKQSIINKLKSVNNKVWNIQLFNDQIKLQNVGNKLRTYRTSKTNIKQEKYIQILDQKQRQILCKFRISSHDLEIKKRRYYQIEPEKRTCKLCNFEVDYEMLFLLKCSKLEETRSVILNSIYLKYKNILLLNTNQKFV